KLALYLALLSVMAWLGWSLRSTLLTSETPPLAGGTSTHATATASNDAATAGATNLAVGTNPVSATNPATEATATPDEPTLRKSSPRMGRLMAIGIGMFFTLIGLSLLLAQDISRFLANRVEDFIFNDDLKGVTDPEYEEAEKVWAAGRYLEAIQLMREYLKRHPREQYVALRIAEIYEANLNNYVAAALEYEEILKKKLPAERWGWAAIHLANLYSGKLNKVDDATKLLRRIVDEFGQ